MSTPAQPPVTQQQTAEKKLLHAIWQAFDDHFLKPLISEAPKWLRYLYFLRFSILLWLFPLALWWANWRGHLRSIVSGIVTPVTEGQYLCVSFFLIASSFVALMQARVVAINGEERFGEAPPERLRSLLANDQARREWIAPVLAQLNTAGLFLYFFFNGSAEGVNTHAIVSGLAIGSALAVIFWYAVNAIYYLTWRPHGGSAKMHIQGVEVARTLLFPRSWLFLDTNTASLRLGDVLEAAETPFRLQWLARLFPARGYKWQDGSLYEGQYFSLLAAIGFFGLYFVLCPLTAPVPVLGWAAGSWLVEVAAGVILVWFVWSAGLPRVEGEKSKSLPPSFVARRRRLFWWKIGIVALILVFSATIPCLFYTRDSERFPILALVLILVTSLAWFFGGIAFWADRFRIPVLTAVVLALLLPRVVLAKYFAEEHHFSIVLEGTKTQPPTPGQILDSRIALDSASGQASDPPGQSASTPEHTFIIVTSTGGGIHAAAWTAAILEHLEERFQGSFHDHVLLLSTVSGGSAGLYTYLRELDTVARGGSPQWNQMVIEAECSSLEAVGWGLVYRDMPKALLPPIPYFLSPSSGIGDLGESPLGMDRTWALRSAFQRNLNDSFCKSDESTTKIRRRALIEDQNQNPGRAHALTLAAFNPIAVDHPFPAFTMNTTTVEQGSRFLLANYWVNLQNPDQLAPAPAESFLRVYGSSEHFSPAQPGYADLPLATAAQLSATFPYVSSAATFPQIPKLESAHFVDGGYYDNDGTASAIEFLRAALDGSKAMKDPPSGSPTIARSAHRLHASSALPQPKLRILLVEIRNSLDPSNPNHVPGAPISTSALHGDQNGKPWNLLDQLAAPPKAFYAGGHDSVTNRNRDSLALLEHAYAGRLILQHFVIDDETNGLETVSSQVVKDPPTDPLNWSLTPAQQAEIDRSAALYKDKYEQIHACFTAGQLCPLANDEASDSSNAGAQPTKP